MSIIKLLEERRSYYQINKKLPVTEDEIIKLIYDVTRLVPDAFNMKSARVAIVLGKKHEQLWDIIYNAFDGKVTLAKIAGFRSGAGTILYFYDQKVVNALQSKFPAYANNFPIWSQQANGMLQFSIWSALRELDIGASLQHYNPVIDTKVRKFLNLPTNYILVAQMPFGGIAAEPATKPQEDISQRVSIHK